MNGQDSMRLGFDYVLGRLRASAENGGLSANCGLLQLLGDMLRFYRNHWGLSADWAYEDLVQALRDPADLLMAAAIGADGGGLDEAASILADAAATLSRSPEYRITSAAFLRKGGELARAREICRSVDEGEAGFQAALSELFACDVAERFWSQDYYDFLGEIHRELKPPTYVEIGVATGKSLALAGAETVAIGVDPASADFANLIYRSPANTPRLYKMTSDDFFATTDLKRELGRSHFDVAFIDGLHHFDQVLRDFINLEKHAGPNSVILIHDCLPINRRVASRDRTTAFWTGDVWKIIPCLQTVRPDLEIVTLPLPPSGVAVVRRLDPSSRILERQHNSLAHHFDQLQMPETWEDCCRALKVDPDPVYELTRCMPFRSWS
jgi:predicted O-methyltransferase YrrM